MRNRASIHGTQIDSAVDLAGLPREELEAMAEAGEEIVEIHRVLAKTGDNIVGELLRGHETFYEWDHYPPGDVFDHETHGQYYYHAHAKGERFAGEHGHFHSFLRTGGMPPEISPAPVPNLKMPEDPTDVLSHLVAISMTKEGLPFCLFTTNRWVTGEVWYQAEDVCRFLGLFEIGHAQPSWPVNRWITAMIRLFRPQIAALLDARDAVVSAWAERHPDRDVYEDRELEITSHLDISVENQARSVAKLLMARR